MSMATSNNIDKINGISWILALIYAIFYICFLGNLFPNYLRNLAIVSLLILLPPLFYGFAYYFPYHLFCGTTGSDVPVGQTGSDVPVGQDERNHIKTLSEIWGPFWAASSALLLVVYNAK